mmetsp:Transcript_13268/g.18511  ORF Transcript_13268/g.18511 Transcript_13268/m.18511 type:complete len:220 (-) Transcript_13268:4299-4958(-)
MHLRGGILLTIVLSILLLVNPVDPAGKQLPTSKSEVDRQNDNNEKNPVTPKAKPNDPEDLESQEWYDEVTFEDTFRDEDDGEERHLNHKKNDNIKTGEENKTAIKKEESRGIFHRLVHALGFSQNDRRSEGAQSDDEMKSSGEQPDPDNIEANLAFCGIIGNPSRREYSILGNCVNLAARLMTHSKKKRGGVICDGATWHITRQDLKFYSLGKLTKSQA